MTLRIKSTFFLSILFMLHSLAYAKPPLTHTSHALSLHDTPKYGPNAKHFDYVDPNAKKGGTLRLSGSGTFDSLNPFIPKGNSATGLGLIYETLAVSSNDEASTLYGLIAEKIELADDNAFVIFHINPKARFHDGHPITAEDVVFSFNILLEEGGPTYKTYYADISHAEVLGKLRVKFHFKNKENKELAISVAGIAILPKHFWKDKEFGKSNLDIPLGSGPYKISEVKPGKTVAFQRVKDYWAQDHFVNKGQYNFDTVAYEYYQDRSVTFEAFKANEYDVRYELTAKTWATGYDFPAIKSGQVKRIELADGIPKGLLSFMLNQRREQFQDIHLREAMDYAFDYEWTNANIFHNSYMRSHSYFSNSEFESNGPLLGRELEILLPYKDKLPKSVFNSYYQPPTTDGSGNNRKNLRIAKKILTSAGYKVENNKLISPKNQKPVKIKFLLYDSSITRIVNPYIKNLERLGIDADIEIVDQTQYMNRLNTFDFDIVMLSIPQSLSPGNEQRNYWHSSSADQEFSSNLMGIKNDVVDRLVDNIINAQTKEERLYQTRALDRVMLNYHFSVPLYHSGSHRIAYWDKFSRPKNHAPYDSRYRSGFFTWWIDKEKEKALVKDRK